MIFPLSVAGLLLLPTVAIALLWTLVRRIRGKPVRSFLVKWMWVHVFLFLLHLFVVFPGWLGWFGVHGLGTRPDERAYEGPRIAEDGTWTPQDSSTLKAEAEAAAPPAEDVVARARATAVSVAGAVLPDGSRVQLNVYRVKAKQDPPRAVVVLVHGLFRSALELEPPARMFRELGCECWLVEQRNHGHSGRATATFGPHEAKDLVEVVRFVQKETDREVVLFGVSLGTVATALALPELDRVAGVVLDAPVSDLLSTARRLMGADRGSQRRRFRVEEPFASLAIASVQLWSGVDLASVKPGEALYGLGADLPILLVGGDGDDKVPPESVQQLHEELPMGPGTKEVWIVAGARHGDAWLHAPEAYAEKLEALLSRCR